MGDSVAFDRAAEYYDRTRGGSPEGMRKTIAQLAKEFGGLGRVLEVGVGTGQIALPLQAVGVPVVGLDLARPMMEKLVAKAGGRSPVPLVQGDATRMPFRDRVFGGAYLRSVLHLIPAWREALADMARVVRPGGVLLMSMASYVGPKSEIQERFAELSGVSIEPPGLTWDRYDELDEAANALGLSSRDLPPIQGQLRDSLDTFVEGIANNAYSWTWKVEDRGLFARTAVDVRRWAEERYGPLDQVPVGTYETLWRAYDIPA
jgi:SAM-dependent methyltransferase